jgi:pSer/pThr/pTyr-binding forkhead associated (FHA) protein
MLPFADRNEFTLGRVSEGQPVMPDIDLGPYQAYTHGVSRLHAVIRRGVNNVLLSDLESANGTFVNGQRLEANQESMDNLRTNLAEQGYSLEKIPFVIQYNKRDLPNVVAVEELRELLNVQKVPDYEANARAGMGVFDTLKAVSKLVLTELKRGG